MTTSGTGVRGAVGIPPGRPAWRKAPARLIHRPALFAALALGGLLVTVTAAAAPLFVAAAESQLLTATIENPGLTRYRVGITYHATRVPFGPLTQERDTAFRDQAAKSPVLGPVLASLAAPPVRVTAADGDDPGTGPISGRLFAGEEALDHIQILAGHDGDGVWLPDLIASAIGAHPGDVVMLHDGGRAVRVRVDGIFRALYAAPDGYWQPWTDDFYLPCTDCVLPPQFIITDAGQLMALQEKLHRPQADQAWQAPVRADPPLTLAEARTLAAFAADLETRMQGDAATQDPLGTIFQCCGRTLTGIGDSDTRFASASGGVVRILEERSPAVRSPVSVLLIAGLAISFAAIAAAAVFSVASRPDETGLLRARGWSPPRVGARTALEAAVPVTIGTVTGFLLAVTVIATLGPAGATGAPAMRTAILGSVAAAVASLFVVALVSGVLFASSHEHKERLVRAFLWFPWELVAFAAAWALGRSLATQGGVARIGTIEGPRAAVFLYPLMLALAVGILVGRIGTVLVVRRARARGGTRVSAGWLAVRRLASSRRLGVIFVVAVALAVAVFVSAQGLVASLRTTVEAKAQVFVGSNVQVQTVSGATPPATFPFPITEVQRASQAGTFDDGQGADFDLLVVDPSTFEAAAYWNDSFADASLPQLLEDLDSSGGEGVPIVLANGGGLAPSSMRLNGVEAPVEIVARASAFPGASSPRPLVVIGKDAVEPAFGVDPYRVTSTYSTTEFWIRGPVDEVRGVVGGSGLQAYLVLTANEVMDIPIVVAVVNTLLVLDVLGLVALMLIVVLAMVYLQARQRSRVVASALSSRMGVRARTMRAALVLELAVSLFLALAAGGIVGIVTLPTVLDAVAPLPSVPPPPIVMMPWPAVVGAALLLAGAALIGGRLADRVARRASLGEVMRVAG